ncbi:hypothetical protein ETD83_10935 [Actinomadura soli]|uniref:Uncharacterized protein n=1 Tax=Actinomadura soli TaxID=2508997 RepID=A0A5C4JF64_9ACTN|nr:hypothetical protein [Actinomadura soli]TMR03412.1 hypothetical protein ETD83_10935 [Actinomadura soli]
MATYVKAEAAVGEPDKPASGGGAAQFDQALIGRLVARMRAGLDLAELGGPPSRRTPGRPGLRRPGRGGAQTAEQFAELRGRLQRAEDRSDRERAERLARNERPA